MSAIREGTSATGSRPASVTLVGDETLFRDLLRGALEQTGQVRVIGSYARSSLNRPKTPVKGFNVVPAVIYVNGSEQIRR